MKTTQYYEAVARHRHPEVQPEWCERVIRDPLAVEVQPDGRIRHWGTVPEFGERVLRVVTLEDGETVHNAFFDRQFKLNTGEVVPEGAVQEGGENEQ